MNKERLTRKEQIRDGVDIPSFIAPTYARLLCAIGEGIFLTSLALGIRDMTDPKSALLGVFCGTVGYCYMNR